MRVTASSNAAPEAGLCRNVSVIRAVQQYRESGVNHRVEVARHVVVKQRAAFPVPLRREVIFGGNKQKVCVLKYRWKFFIVTSFAHKEISEKGAATGSTAGGTVHPPNAR